MAALASRGIGVVIQVPFLAQALYTGADISWLVGTGGVDPPGRQRN